MPSWDTRAGDRIDVRVVSADNRDDSEYALDVGELKVTKRDSSLMLDPTDGDQDLQKAWNNNRQLQVEIVTRSGQSLSFHGILTDSPNTLRIM